MTRRAQMSRAVLLEPFRRNSRLGSRMAPFCALAPLRLMFLPTDLFVRPLMVHRRIHHLSKQPSEQTCPFNGILHFRFLSAQIYYVREMHQDASAALLIKCQCNDAFARARPLSRAKLSSRVPSALPGTCRNQAMIYEMSENTTSRAFL